MKKKNVIIMAAIVASMAMLSGCGASASENNDIATVSREEGSGTRGAFIELFEIEEKNDAGEKIDNTTEEAKITNSTSVMMTTVQGDKNAIGYISTGSLNDTVKAAAIDGAEATPANIENGSYKIVRPFNIAVNDDLSATAEDFIAYIMSAEGQQIVEDNGYIAVEAEADYKASVQSGKVVVAGSSSVTPVMEKLKEAYETLNPDVDVEVQQSDSTTGVQSTIDGLCDIGMASRELKDSELEEGLSPIVIAKDGIAVIINNDNESNDLTSEQVKGIFTGEILTWDEVNE